MHRAVNISPVEDIIANGDMHIAARFFLLLKIAVAPAGGIQPNAEFGDIVRIFYRFYDVAQLSSLGAISFDGNDPAPFYLEGDRTGR